MKLTDRPFDFRRYPKIILASTSPRRRALLAESGIEFEAVDSVVDEPPYRGFPNPAAYVSYLAWLKGSAIKAPARWVLSADTVTSIDNDVLGKPVDRADAERILRRLQGTDHQVLTGVCLRIPSLGVFLQIVDVAEVAMKPLDDRALARHLDEGQWEGKAGAYGVQDENDPLVTLRCGSFTNVVGLPMERVQALLDYAERLTDPTKT